MILENTDSWNILSTFYVLENSVLQRTTLPLVVHVNLSTLSLDYHKTSK